MKLLTKRLFISDLPPNLTEGDLNEKFSKFGKVISVEIKHRKNITSKNQHPTFAFVNIDIDNSNLQQCFEDFAKNKWKGNYVELQIAKESFLERLKKERESDKLVKLSNKVAIHQENLSINCTAKRKEFYSLDFSSNDSGNEDPFIKKKKTTKNIENINLSCGNNKKNINIIENKITADRKDLDAIVHNNINEKTAKITLAEQKRLHSITEMKKSYQKQKNVIKAALANVDTKSNQKIVFDEDDDERNDRHFIQNNFVTDFSGDKNEENLHRKVLFENDSDEDDAEYNFEVKQQFQGKKGRKLMELQSKFKNDKRFTMDERFLEDDCNDEDTFKDDKSNQKKTDKEPITTEEIIDNETEITIEEKQKELLILEDILGKKLVKDKEITSKKEERKMGMTRYDPSKVDHSKYTFIEEEQIKVKKKTKVKEQSDTNTEIQETEKPIVSKETFYEVKENLKESLEENKSFSLLNMFDSHRQSDDEIVVDSVPDNKELEKGNLLRESDRNPFRYDSSDDSENEENLKANNEEQKEVGENKIQDNAQNVSLGPTRLWTEPFFFKDDDYRFQEGIDFVRKFELDDKLEFKQVRRNIKEIVRAKVRNNQRKNKPFKKKLGGRKMIKIKKAMKTR